VYRHLNRLDRNVKQVLFREDTIGSGNVNEEGKEK
jgi:hypothetical protein